MVTFEAVCDGFNSLLLNSIKTNTLFENYLLVAFIEQKENDNNDNQCKIHGGLYIASALLNWQDFVRG